MNKIITDMNEYGRKGAFRSFLIGTLFLIFFLIFKTEYIFFPAYIFGLLAFIFNSIVLLILIAQAILDKKNKKEYLITMAIILLNLPITYFYLALVFN